MSCLSTQPALLHVFIAVRSILDLPQVILVRARWGLHGTRTASHDGCIWSTVRRRERRPHDQRRKNHRRKRSRSRIQHALTSCGHIIVSPHQHTSTASARETKVQAFTHGTQPANHPKKASSARKDIPFNKGYTLISAHRSRPLAPSIPRNTRSQAPTIQP